MKIKYLGTAAYEGVPSLFCQCEVCKQSIAKQGRNIRGRSQALIDGELLIDFCPDTVANYHKYRYDFNKIHNCIITHSHSDHLLTEDIGMLAEGYSPIFHRDFRFYAGQSGYDKITDLLKRQSIPQSVTCVLVVPFAEFNVGAYRVLPLEANHDPSSSPVIYAIERDGKRLLYANDTGYFCEKSWNKLKSFGTFDVVSLDCTGALQRGWTEGHMSFDTNLKVKERMLNENIAADKTVFVINHFSHNGGATYDQMAKTAIDYGFIVSYDGLEIEV